MSDTTEAARLWMLEVISCDEVLGDDEMCDCAREHFDVILAAEKVGKRAGLEQALDVMPRSGESTVWEAAIRSEIEGEPT